MVTHSSASVRVETPHKTETIQITISDALRRRAQAVINDRSIDPQWRAIIRYALQINDPWLPDLVRRSDAGEAIIDIDTMSLSSRTPPSIEAATASAMHVVVLPTPLAPVMTKRGSRRNLCWCSQTGQTA
jgi:hypothetical protein